MSFYKTPTGDQSTFETSLLETCLRGSGSSKTKTLLRPCLENIIRESPQPSTHPYQEARKKATTDLHYLLSVVLGRTDTDHPWVRARCDEVQENPDGYLDLWAREHYKSTVITFGKTIQDILADPERTFCILSYNRPTAKAFLRQIKLEFENNECLKALFSDVLYKNPKKEAPKWSEDEGIVVRRRTNPKESTVEAWGLVDGQPTGRHYHVLVYDDIVTKESVTEGMLPKVTNAWELSVNLGRDGGVKRYAGTRYHDADTYGVILERQVTRSRIYPATVDGTSAGGPVMMSQEYLNEKRMTMSPYNFACQMLLDPVPDDTSYFTRDMFGWYDWSKRSSLHGIKHLASDWAVTHGGGDYTVHGVGLVDPDDDLYVIDWWREQAATDISADIFVELLEKHSPRDYIAEKAQIERSVGPFLHRLMKERGAYCTPALYTSAGDKATKAQSIRGRAAHGKVKLPFNAPWTNALINECLRFPYGVHDDQVDVLGLFGRHLEALRGPYVPEPVEIPQHNSGQQLIDSLQANVGRKTRYA